MQWERTAPTAKELPSLPPPRPWGLGCYEYMTPALPFLCWLLSLLTCKLPGWVGAEGLVPQTAGEGALT